jgi:gluconolactonase
MGEVDTLYTECNGRKLSGPNDIVFDTTGGMWFTDQGKYYETYKEHGAVYYAKLDGSFISRQLEKLETPNGIRLSPDGNKVYYSETTTGRIWSFTIQKPGLLDPDSKKLVIGLPGYQLFDSFTLDANGNICAAILMNGGISIISPEGTLLRHIPTNDILTTSICFGGKDRKNSFYHPGSYWKACRYSMG